MLGGVEPMVDSPHLDALSAPEDTSLLPPLPPAAADKDVPRVTEEQFLKFWQNELARYDPPTRLFRLLRQPGAKYLTRDDFRPLLQEIVNRHSGLRFLAATPEFQLKYAQTVIARIFLMVNKSGNEQMTLRELKSSNLLQKLLELDEEEDINKIHDYFSYEHFYVLFCKFWELDTDKDGYVTAEDLERYEDHSLTKLIIQRVVEGAGRKLLSGVKGKLSYYDFIVFLVCEVDKTSDVSVEYWFRCVDLDGDGVISAYEMEAFLAEQLPRIQALSPEPVRMEDLICQLNDMVKPKTPNYITVKDIKAARMGSLFFNTLFNIIKLCIHESRDPNRAQHIIQTPHLSDWDRYAIAGYYALAGGAQAEESASAAQEPPEEEEPFLQLM